MISRHVVNVLSGKGGTGKTSLAAGIAFESAAVLGRRTLMVDADFELPNAHLLFKVLPTTHFENLMAQARRHKTLRPFILSTPYGVDVLSAFASKPKELNERSLGELGRAILKLPYDVVVFDGGAGLHAPVRAFAPLATDQVVVTVNDPLAYLDAYQAVAMVHEKAPQVRATFVVNQIYQLADAKKGARDFAEMVDENLSVALHFLGFIPYDPHIRESAARQEPFAVHGKKPGSKALKGVVQNLFGLSPR